MSAISSLRPAEVRQHLRGDIEKFDKTDRFFLGLKKITKIDDGKHYRFCYICSKIQKYLDKKHLNPDYYEAKIDVKLRDLVQLVHDHIAEVGPSEENFYEFILEGFGILSQNVRFNTDPYIRFLKIVIEEHAKFRATDNGELTAVSLIEFCTHLDTYVNAALKPVVPDWYHLFLGPQHPAAQLLFKTKGKKEEKISPDTVKADIRSRMLDNVVELFGKDLAPHEKIELKTALDRLAAQLKANPSSAQNLAELLANNNASKAGNPEFTLIGMRLFNAREALGKTQKYTYQELMKLGEPNLSYCHPFITDVRFCRDIQKQIDDLEKNVGQLQELVQGQSATESHRLGTQIAYLKPRIQHLMQECEKIEVKLKNIPPTLAADAQELTRQFVELKAQLQGLKADTEQSSKLTLLSERSLQLRSQVYDSELLAKIWDSHKKEILDFQVLTARKEAADRRPSTLPTLLATYCETSRRSVSQIQNKSYHLSPAQIREMTRIK